MKNVRIEILYPEFNHLYGDTGNIRYLCERLRLAGASAELIETNLQDRPAFTTETVDFLYVGPCTERQQLLVLEALQPWKDALAQRMAGESVTLLTGNAFELLGQSIRCCDGSDAAGLALLPVRAERFNRLRYNDLCIGDWQGINVVGFKNQLSHSYLTSDEPVSAFLKMEKGCGLNPKSADEGFWSDRFLATYLVGPLLALNPLLSDKLLNWLIPEADELPHLPFEMEAYRRRLEEFRK